MYLWNVYILSEEGDGDGHCIHLAVYKNTHKIAVAKSSAFDAEIWFVYKEITKKFLCEINWVQGGSRIVFFKSSNGWIRKKKTRM